MCVLDNGAATISVQSFGSQGIEHNFSIEPNGDFFESFWQDGETTGDGTAQKVSAARQDIIGPHSQLLRLLPTDVQKALRPYFAQGGKQPSVGKEDMVGERSPKARVVDFQAKECRVREEGNRETTHKENY